MEYKELNIRIELHKQWLEDNRNGKRLVLDKVDLSNMNISNKTLDKCVLRDCDIRGANLTNTSFTGSEIVNCNLSYCNMIGTNISRCKLTGTIMNNANVGIGSKMNRQNIYDILENDDDDMCKFESSELTEEDLDDISK